jgi:hydroxyacylglutathione hydrolase
MIENSIDIDISTYELNFDEFYTNYQKLSPSSDEYVLLDFRPEEEIYNGFIPSSIACDIRFFPKLIPKESKLLLIITPYYEEDVISFLKFNGYDNIIGFLSGGIDKWIEQKKPLTLFPETQNPEIVDSIIDCREPREWNYGVVDCDSITYMQLGKIPKNWGNLKRSVTYGVVCKRGGRSLAATTYLMSKGFKVINLGGGIRNLICSGFKLVKKCKQK